MSKEGLACGNAPFFTQDMEIKTVKLSTLRPHPKNPRTHPESAITKLVKSVQEFGWTNPILVSKDGYILAGHARLKAAEKAGLKEVPVIYLPLAGDKAIAYMIADNKLQDETDWDYHDLKDLLQELDTGAFDIELTGFDMEEIEELFHVSGIKSGTSSIGQLYIDHDIEPFKLAHRIEVILKVTKKSLLLDLFSGAGQLAAWYRRHFDRVITVDQNAQYAVDYVMKAGDFIRQHIDQFMDFDYVDFDDEGTPAAEIKTFFSAIEGKKKTPFVLALTDGFGTYLILRGKTMKKSDISNLYLFEESLLFEGLEQPKSSPKSYSYYYQFEAIVTRFVQVCAEKTGFIPELISSYLGQKGQVLYQTWFIRPLATNSSDKT